MTQRIFYNTAREPILRMLDKTKNGSWLSIESPDEDELRLLATTYKLDEDLLLDGIDANEAPRIERSEGKTYIYTRYCLPEESRLTTAPLLIVYGEDMVITISRSPFSMITHFTDGRSPIITGKRTQLVFQMLSEINAGYKQRINQTSKKIWNIRSQLNRSHIDNATFVGFIDIEEDLNDFLLALQPTNTVLNTLLSGKFMRLYDDDKDLIEDLVLGSEELINLVSSLLKTIQNVREAYSTITANNLNKVFKLMTSITILMSIFTLVTGIYSMNIALPAAHNPEAFWIILGFTTAVIAWVAFLFKRKGWF